MYQVALGKPPPMTFCPLGIWPMEPFADPGPVAERVIKWPPCRSTPGASADTTTPKQKAARAREVFMVRM
jgi:hypothetical protein